MTLFWLTIAITLILCGLALRYIPVTRCWMLGHETVGTKVMKPYPTVRYWCPVCKRDRPE